MRMLQPRPPRAWLAVLASVALPALSPGSSDAQNPPVSFVITAEPQNLVNGSLKLYPGQTPASVWLKVVNGTSQASLIQSNLTWTSSDSTVVRLIPISSSGRQASGLQDGSATITVTAQSPGAWGPVSASLPVIVGTGVKADPAPGRVAARPGAILQRSPGPVTAGEKATTTVLRHPEGAVIRERPMGAPPSVTVTAVTPTSVTLSWQPVPEAIGYKVVEGPATSTKVLSTDSITTFTHKGLAPNTQYQYTVFSMYGPGQVQSAPASTVSATTLPIPRPQRTP